MNEVLKKIESLENLLEERDRTIKKKIRSSVIIYAIVIVVVAAYTTFIIPQIRMWTSPEVAAEIAGGQLAAYLSTLRENSVEQIKSNSDLWAKAIVDRTLVEIPNMEKPVLKAFDDLIDYMAQHIEHVLIPAFTSAMKDNAAELKDRYADFRDEEKMQGLALIFVEIFEIEMDKYVNDRFLSEIESLRLQLRGLNQPDDKLTAKQIAQRKVLINWMYLSEHQAFGETKIANKIQELKDKFVSLLEFEEQEKELEDIEVGEQEEL